MERSHLAKLLLGAAVALALFPFAAHARAPKLALPGLEKPVEVLTDELGVPHIYAKSDHDVFFVQGYVHARDRFFQMDANRRAAAGTLAELTGMADLFQDALVRPLGLRAAAERSFDLLEARELALAQAYADGVNAWLSSQPLPPEYGALEVTAVAPWSVLDTLLLVKAAAASLDVRRWEIDETAAVQGYVDALGEAGAAALYPADLGRLAPWVPRATVPDALGTPLTLARTPQPLPLGSLARSAAAARRLRAHAEPIALLASALEWSDVRPGSNAWGVAGSKSASGRPLVAGDGHDDLTAPARDYPIHLVVKHDPALGALNVSGGSAPGVPGVLDGQNTSIAWAGSSIGLDLSDVFHDRLVRDDPACAARLCIDSAGALHPVEERTQSYRYNLLDGVSDNSADGTAIVGAVAPEAVDVLSVPFRSFGPIVEVEDRSVVDGGLASETSVLTLQYTGLHGGREAKFLTASMRARDVFEFRDGLRSLTVPGGGGNYVVADVAGNLAYFSAAEVPLRSDLEAGALAGAPPWLIRDGSGPSNWVFDPARSQGQAIPFAVIPFDEMPQVVNPPAGFVVTCNEDASGFVVDNDLLNQFRPSQPMAIHYLGDIGTRGLRNGRVTALLKEKIEAGEKLSPDDMKRIQANTQALHAELLVPFLLAAFEAAQRPGAPAQLAALAADARIVEAAARLAAWDFSHPTGIPEGYDASDVDGVRDPLVSDAEAQASIAATLYNVWFAKLLARFRGSVQALGLSPLRPIYTFFHLLSQDPFTGVGASGIDFFPQPAALADPEDRRDLMLLGALRDALNALAGPAYAPAFARSTDQDDYRWGRLNRLVLAHRLGGDSSIPPAAGFADLAPDLRGLARDGTWETVNVTLFAGLSDGADAFVSSFGSVFRHVLSPLHPSGSGSGMQGFASLAGGASGDPASPTYASQLGAWLTVDHHEMPMSKGKVRRRAVATERFVPAKLKTAGKAEGGAHASE